MKNKKKPIQSKTPNPIHPIKLLNIKTTQGQKNIISTNQKTFTTIEQNLRTYENADTEGKRQSLKERLSFNKKSCITRMQENNLSPFSNDGRSTSPKYRKTPEKLLTTREQKEVKFAINLKQFEKKKIVKSKASSARQARSQLTTNTNIKKPSTIKPSSTLNHTIQTKKKSQVKKKPLKIQKKQQKARIQFQNQFLSMMNNKIHKQKITQISQEELEYSVRRKPKLQLQILIDSENTSKEQVKKREKFQEKRQIVNTMKLKVMKNIQRDFPNLHQHEKKLICAVIIIQRLWRQSKVKQFFQHYITPRASPETSVRESFQKQLSSNRSTIQLLSNHLVKSSTEQRSQQTLPKKKYSVQQQQQGFVEQNIFVKQNNFLICQQSQQSIGNCPKIPIHPQKESQLNDRVTQLLQESILSFQNQNQKIINQTSNQNVDRPSMLKFVECYRQVKLKNTKKVSKSKRNIFSLKQSLSQKCLMQKYYNKIFSDKPEKNKPKNYELFSLQNNKSKLQDSTLKLNQQSSIQLFKQINQHPDYISPQKKQAQEKTFVRLSLTEEGQSQSLVGEQEEETWVRNDTNYSQQTDSDQFIGRKDQSSQNQRKVIVDEISHGHGDNFYKKDTGFIISKDRELSSIKDGKQQILQPNKDNQQIKNEETENAANHRPLQTLSINIENKQKSLQSNEKREYSLKQIQTASDQIMSQLMNQFFKQYMSFQQKQCLVKKRKHRQQQQKEKKPRLPGIEITHKTITQYLDILIPYILTKDRQQVLHSLQLFHPLTYQKCHRVESMVYEVFQFGQEQEEEDIYWNIISNQGFFSCLEMFWSEHVTLTKEKQSFKNFIDLTYKVYNRCITDAFSQIFSKQVLQRICYPWNRLSKNNNIIFSNETKSIINQTQIQSIAFQVKQKLLKQSFCYSTTEGKLIQRQRRHKRRQQPKQYQFGQKPLESQSMIQKLSDDEFSKVMKIANDEFLEDERELVQSYDQRYELNADLGELIMNSLIQEFQTQLGEIEVLQLSEQNLLSKSQNQVFLETNETLQTNYHL